MNKDLRNKRPVGRPKLDKTLSTKLPVVRVSEKQLATYKSNAECSGLTFSGWIRKCLDKAST